MRFDTLRTLLASAAIEDRDIQQIDIKGAYLNGQLKEEIYMCRPPCYKDGTDRVCRSLRASHDWKQAGNVGNMDIDQTITKVGMGELLYAAHATRPDIF
jgi:hypothetical protein